MATAPAAAKEPATELEFKTLIDTKLAAAEDEISKKLQESLVEVRRRYAEVRNRFFPLVCARAQTCSLPRSLTPSSLLLFCSDAHALARPDVCTLLFKSSGVLFVLTNTHLCRLVQLRTQQWQLPHRVSVNRWKFRVFTS